MNLFGLSGLLIGISCTAMAGLVYFTSRRTRATRLWAIFCLAVSLWGFGAFLIASTRNPEIALVWWRLAHVGVISIPVLFYHFVTVFANVRRPRLLTVAYAAWLAFLVADATPLFIAHARPVFGEFFYDSPPGPLYLPFVAFFIGLIILSHVELWRARRHTTQPVQRILLQWLTMGTAIGFTGGALAFLPVVGIDLYPYGNFAVAAFPLIMTYAFLRYRIIDVNAAVVRGVAFLLVYLVVVAAPFLTGYYYQDLWRSTLGEWWWLAPVVLMGLLASACPVLFLFLSRRLEAGLWKAQRRYHRTLIAASSYMTQIKDIGKLCHLIVRVVNRTVQLSHSGIFLYEPKEKRYVLRAVRHRGKLPEALSLAETDPVIQALQAVRDLVLMEDLQAEAAAAAGSERPRAQEIGRVCEWMGQFDAKLVVPSFSNERLLAFLILGGKRSGERYSTDDIAIFSALANQAALAIENAMFIEELRDNEAHMIQSEKLASLGQLASGMAHEIHNPLTIISGESQLYLERFKGQDARVDHVLTSIIEECHRAADITRRILRFAKPAPTDMAALDLKATVEESLALAGYQVKLEKVERIVEVPADLPKVRANQNQLQEVLLNLILNACQAMGEKGGTLMVRAHAANGAFIELQVADTGPGIPAGKLGKVFDPFYTTKVTGTGLGLFVTQRIIKSHGGTITVESEEGKGACFTIHLPVWK